MNERAGCALDLYEQLKKSIVWLNKDTINTLIFSENNVAPKSIKLLFNFRETHILLLCKLNVLGGVCNFELAIC